MIKTPYDQDMEDHSMEDCLLSSSNIIIYSNMSPSHNARCAEGKWKFYMGNTSKFLMLMFTQYSLYLIYALLLQIQLCRNSALFGEALLAKIWWGEAQKHFKGPGMTLTCTPRYLDHPNTPVCSHHPHTRTCLTGWGNVNHVSNIQAKYLF